jgi:hypothetical protein
MKIIENILWLVILLCLASLAIISVIAWNNLVIAAVFAAMCIMWIFTLDFNK